MIAWLRRLLSALLTPGQYGSHYDDAADLTPEGER